MNPFANTAWISIVAALLACGMGAVFALAWLACGPSLRRAGLVLAAASLALPPFLVANYWLEISAPWRLAWGGEGSRVMMLPLAAVVLGALHWPVAALLAAGAASRIEPAVLESDPSLRGWRAIRHVFLPALLPALGVAFVLCSVLSASNFAIPTLFQVPVLPETLWLRFNTQLDVRGAWLAGLPLILLGVASLAWLRRRPVRWPTLSGGADGRSWRRSLGSAGWIAGAIALAVVGFSLVAPAGHLLGSGRTWAELGPATSAGVNALGVSAAVAAAVAVLVLVLGLALAALPRADSGRWLAWMWFLVPGILTGSLWVGLLARPVARPFADSPVVLVAILLPRYLAIGWAAAVAARDQVDPAGAESLRLAGGTRARVGWHAVWPQVRESCLWGAYAVYLLVLWDVESVVLVLPPGVETLAVRIFNLLHYGHAGQVNALCIALLGIAILPPLLRYLLSPVKRWTGPAVLGLVAGLVAGCDPGAGARVAKSAALDSRWFGSVEVIGGRGVAPGQFNKPRSLVCDREDNLYVADITGRIQKFDRTGRFVRQWQMPQTDLGKPKGMGLDPDGNVLVVEPHYMRVNHFDPDGRLVAQWGSRGTNLGSFILPRSIAVASDGSFFLSEYTVVDRVQRFSPMPAAGQGGAPPRPVLLHAWGVPGDGPGQFNRAEGIGLGPGDTLYVADSCNHRIQVFDKEGKFLRQHGRAGSNPGEFSYPYDVRVDTSGNQFVCEFGNSRITVLDAQDRVIEVIGGAGSAPGRFANPWSIAFDSRGNLYVADSKNHRVQKLVRRAAPAASTRNPNLPAG